MIINTQGPESVQLFFFSHNTGTLMEIGLMAASVDARY